MCICRNMWVYVFFPIFLHGCRSKDYSPAYNLHAGTSINMRYHSAGQSISIVAEPLRNEEQHAKLKFSPPANKVKLFGGKEAIARACVSKSDLGKAVNLGTETWFDGLVLESDNMGAPRIEDKVINFSIKSEVDEHDEELHIRVVLKQESDDRVRMTIERSRPAPIGPNPPKPLAVLLFKSSRSVKKWKSDINEVVSIVMHTRNVLMSCILSANR
jgi:hypothetical protein